MAHPAAAREVPPRLELDCLKALWTLGEANVRQVQEALMPERVLAYIKQGLALVSAVSSKTGGSRGRRKRT